MVAQAQAPDLGALEADAASVYEAMYAESVMDLRPWGYWMPDGEPYEGTKEIVSTVESVLERRLSLPAWEKGWIAARSLVGAAS